MLARLLEAYVDVRGMSLNGIGSTLAIEVVQTHGGIDKLEIYRRFGVREVWFWIDGAIWVYQLVADKFESVERSVAFPDLDLHELARRVLKTDDSEQAEAVRAFRKWLELSRRRRLRTRR